MNHLSPNIAQKLKCFVRWMTHHEDRPYELHDDFLATLTRETYLKFRYMDTQSFSASSPSHHELVEFWGLPPLILFFNTSTGWFGRFVLSTECYRTRKLDYNDLNWPRCSARVTESLALTDGSFCQKQTLYILDYVKIVS